MSNQSLPTISGEFGVVRDPDLRFNDSGRPWVVVRGVAKSRRYDKSTESFVDGDNLYIDILCSGKMAENLTESVTVGDTITVTGNLAYKEWKTKEGESRHSYQIQADYVGVSVRFQEQRSSRLESGMRKSPEAAAQDQAAEPVPF